MLAGVRSGIRVIHLIQLVVAATRPASMKPARLKKSILATGLAMNDVLVGVDEGDLDSRDDDAGCCSGLKKELNTAFKYYSIHDLPGCHSPLSVILSSWYPAAERQWFTHQKDTHLPQACLKAHIQKPLHQSDLGQDSIRVLVLMSVKLSSTYLPLCHETTPTILEIASR